jgi:hypothetical protein
LHSHTTEPWLHMVVNPLPLCFSTCVQAERARAQFAAFVADGGYNTREYWCHEGWRWLTRGSGALSVGQHETSSAKVSESVRTFYLVLAGSLKCAVVFANRHPVTRPRRCGGRPAFGRLGWTAWRGKSTGRPACLRGAHRCYHSGRWCTCHGTKPVHTADGWATGHGCQRSVTRSPRSTDTHTLAIN